MLTVPREALQGYIGMPLAPTDWHRIDQAQIDAFADATLDHQFIHVDRERAKNTPFGTTIAHGYLTMSLISHFLERGGIAPEGAAMAINYGSDRLRFLEPVKVNGEIRGRAELLEVRDSQAERILLKTRVTVDIRNEENPALIAEILTLFICPDGKSEVGRQ